MSGYVKDAKTGETLIGSTVYFSKSGQGAVTNVHGFYSLTLDTDSVLLNYSYVGYKSWSLKFLLYKDTTINANLLSGVELEEVVVTAQSEPSHELNRMGVIDVSMYQLKRIPAFLGEVDILRTLQLMPGVKWSEGSTGLYVRGGGPDQNLMLLDGVPVYNAGHLFGFFSVFNADAVKDVQLIKGGFPARYGGRLSSVVDVSMKDGNMKEIHGEGSVGIIAAKATLEGPLWRDKASFVISARRTYLDALVSPFVKLRSKGESAGYYFYDLNAKFNFIINDRNRVYLSSYTGRDKGYSKTNTSINDVDYRTDFKQELGIEWGNLITALRWNTVITPKIFGNFTGTFTKYRFDILSDYQQQSSPDQGTNKSYHDEYMSGIKDWAIKADFDFIPLPTHYVRFGAGSILHDFTPGVFSVHSTSVSDSTFGATEINANEMSLYAEDDIQLGQNLRVNVGAHVSFFHVEDKWYRSYQPRLQARYLFGKTLSAKASFATMTQFIHLLTNAGLGLPTDLWVPSTSTIKPQQASQVALGLNKSYGFQYEFSIEGYYKKMHNLIEYKDGASFADIKGDWQNKVATAGQGESYGSEFLARKKAGSLTGWVGYTLSWTSRQFDELNFGKWFPYKYDRRHDVSVAVAKNWNNHIDCSAVWVYGTGNAVTLPVSSYMDAPSPYSFIPSSGGLLNYSGRNAFRMRSYHRLDLGVSFSKKKKRGERKWTISVYNAYNRKNPYFIQAGSNGDGERVFIQYSLFPILPSVAYSFKF